MCECLVCDPIFCLGVPFMSVLCCCMREVISRFIHFSVGYCGLLVRVVSLSAIFCLMCSGKCLHVFCLLECDVCLLVELCWRECC